MQPQFENVSDPDARIRDRTAELEASSAQLRQLNEELEQRTLQRTYGREGAFSQLFKAQASGNSPGGIARDFNNLLKAVLGSLTLLKKRLP